MKCVHSTGKPHPTSSCSLAPFHCIDLDSGRAEFQDNDITTTKPFRIACECESWLKRMWDGVRHRERERRLCVVLFPKINGDRNKLPPTPLLLGQTEKQLQYIKTHLIFDIRNVFLRSFSMNIIVHEQEVRDRVWRQWRSWCEDKEIIKPHTRLCTHVFGCMVVPCVCVCVCVCLCLCVCLYVFRKFFVTRALSNMWRVSSTIVSLIVTTEFVKCSY